MPSKGSLKICVKPDTGTVSDHYLLTAKLDTDAVKTGATLWIKNLSEI